MNLKEIEQTQESKHSQLDQYVKIVINEDPNNTLNISEVFEKYPQNTLDLDQNTTTEQIVKFIDLLKEISFKLNLYNSSDSLETLMHTMEIIKEYDLEPFLYANHNLRNTFKPNWSMLLDPNVITESVFDAYLEQINKLQLIDLAEFLQYMVIESRYAAKIIIHIKKHERNLGSITKYNPLLGKLKDKWIIDDELIFQNQKTTNLFLNLHYGGTEFLNPLPSRLIENLHETTPEKKDSNKEETTNTQPEILFQIASINKKLIKEILEGKQNTRVKLRENLIKNIHFILESKKEFLKTIEFLLNNSSFSDSIKEKIINLSSQKKVLDYKDRMRNVIYALLQPTIEPIIYEFVEKQQVNNRGAARFSKICQRALTITNIHFLNKKDTLEEVAKVLEKEKSPVDYLNKLEQVLLKALIKQNNLTIDPKALDSKQKDKLQSILLKLSHMQAVINQSQLHFEVEDLIYGSLLNKEWESKIIASDSTLKLRINTIERFIQNTSLHTPNGVSEETNDFNQILSMGIVPEITCLSYINGVHKRETLGFALLNDRKLVQFKQNDKIYSRASFKILEPKDSDTNHAIFIDNFYGREQDLELIILHAFYKAKDLGLELCIPITHFRKEKAEMFQKSLDLFTSHKKTTSYKKENQNILEMNYSDTLSHTMVIIDGDVKLSSSSTFISATR